MKFGLNDAVEYMAIPGMTACRRSLPSIDASLAGEHPGLASVVSADAHPDQVCSGDIDGQLTAWLQSLPAGTYVTLNPEGNLPSKGMLSYRWREANARLQALKTSAGLADRIFTGYILGAHPVAELGQSVEDWCLGHADWAGVSGFQTEIRQTPTSLFDGIFRQVSAAPGMPELLITETNSEIDPDAWLSAVTEFAVRGIDQGLSGFAPLDGVLVWAAPGSNYPKLPSPDTLARAARECTLVR